MKMGSNDWIINVVTKSNIVNKMNLHYNISHFTDYYIVKDTQLDDQ